MKNKIKVTTEIIHDEETYGKDGGTKEISSGATLNDDPTWKDILSLFINTLKGHDFIISDNIEFVLNSLNGANAKELANLIDDYLTKKED